MAVEFHVPVKLRYPGITPGNLAMYGDDKEITDATILVPDKEITCDIDQLQATLDALPKYINGVVKINVNPGTTTDDITIANFYGGGHLNIEGAVVTQAFTHEVNRVIVSFIDISRLTIQGISTTSDTGTAWNFSNVSSAFAYIYRCNATGGLPTTTSNLGFYMNESSHIYCSTCHVSNKYRGFWARSGRMRIAASYGTDNNVVFNSEVSGFMQCTSATQAEGTTQYRVVDASVLIRPDGFLQTLGAGTAASYSRRSSDYGLVFTTDDILSHGQTLATRIERWVQDQIYVTTNTFYYLRIHIRQGIATNATFRLHGMNIRGYVQVFIDPDVTLNGILIYGNTAFNIIVNNQGTVNGNVTILYNTATVGDIGYNHNYAATVLPVYPATHPLSGQQIPIQHSRVTGGIQIQQNTAANNIYCLLGQHCQVGQPDAHGVVAAPAVGTNSNGVVQLTYNQCNAACYIIVYATYMEADPVIPGPVVSGRLYNYYNEAGTSCYITVQSGWREGTEPTIENAYAYYNKSGTATYLNIGNSRPATTFAGNWTAVAEADPSTTNRNTVVLTANMLAGREEAVVGMGFTFINAGTTSLAANYSGTFKRVTAYDPATRTVTLSANFALARPAGATCYFFPYAAQTKIYYGTSVKIQAMLQDAYAAAAPFGVRQADGNNLGRAYQITDIDTTLKVITIAPGLNANGVYNATFTPCGTFSPRTVQDYAPTFNKIGPNVIRSTGDERFYPYVTRMITGQRITGPGITGSAEVVSADFGGTGLEGRIILTLDTDPNVPADGSVYTYTVRRAPGHGHYVCLYNQAGSDAYITAGYPGMATDGGLKFRSAVTGYNRAGGSCYVNLNDFMGAVVNENGALRTGYLDLYYNTAGASCYVAARANNNPGGDGNVTRIRSYGNSGYEIYTLIGAYTTMHRETTFYNNQARYRAYIDCDLPGGVTISALTAPQLRAYLYTYRNTAPHFWINRMNIKPALIAETGRATDSMCILIQDFNGRSYVGSASMWLDLSNSTVANASCIYANVNTNFEYGFAVNSTYAGAQSYALRVIDNANVRIAARPAGMPKIMLTGYTQAHVGNTLPLDNIYRADHVLGRDGNVVIFQGGRTVLVDPLGEGPAIYAPGIYTYVVDRAGTYLLMVAGAGGGSALLLPGPTPIAGGGSGAVAYRTQAFNAGDSLVVTVGRGGLAYSGDVAGAATAGGVSSIGAFVVANGGGAASVSLTAGIQGTAGAFTTGTGITGTNGVVGTAAGGGVSVTRSADSSFGTHTVHSGAGGLIDTATDPVTVGNGGDGMAIIAFVSA